MSTAQPSHPSSSRVALCLTIASLIAAALWLGARVFLGLDFSDEMQYYGEIASLTRSGKFFQVDLFLQQLGYVFVLPFFKVHALLFPDQSYLVLFGRLLLLGGYVVVGSLVWRASALLGNFSLVARLAGLAAFVGSVPFLIFAPSYNSLAYLLIVALVAVALPRERYSFRRYAITRAALLATLTFVYPPAGLALIVLAGVDARHRHGGRAALQLLAGTALGGLLVLGVMIGLHGPDFGRDLLVGLRFSRAFGVGEEIRRAEQLAGLLALVVATGIFLRALHRPGPAGPAPDAGAATPSDPRWIILMILPVAGGVSWYLNVTTVGGYASTAVYAVLLMMLATGAGLSRAAPPLARSVLAGCWLAVLVLSVRWSPTTYYAATVYVLLLILLAAWFRTEDRQPLAQLALVGTVLGGVFSVTSGNGLHNFGLGAAAVIPFLVLFAARRLGERSANGVIALARDLAMPGVVGLIIVTSARMPYREDRDWSRFQRIRGVPAFAGIFTSAPKLAALQLFATLMGRESLAGKRVLVAGPHPWLYFASRGVPATPMVFMHFDGRPEVYAQLAERLFRTGVPDAIFLTNALPPALKARILEWSAQNCTAQMISVPERLMHTYSSQTRYEFLPEVVLLRRPPGGTTLRP